MIFAEHVTFAYDRVPALAGVGLTARPGQVVGLIGPNGSGKTTLLRALYAALTPRTGLISVDDTPVQPLSPREVALCLAVVVQEAASEVPITVAAMVLLGRSPHRSALQRYTTGDHRIAAEALQRVGARHLADRTSTALSGGEKQRVLIARTLAQQTDHLLLDEPTNHLDIRYQHEILQLVLLDGGRVVCTGAPEAVLTPEVLEPVYGIGVRRLTEGGSVQLIFNPHKGVREENNT